MPKIMTAAPHTALVDAFVLAWAFPIWPAAVAKKELLSAPLFGTLPLHVYMDKHIG